MRHAGIVMRCGAMWQAPSLRVRGKSSLFSQTGWVSRRGLCVSGHCGNCVVPCGVGIRHQPVCLGALRQLGTSLWPRWIGARRDVEMEMRTVRIGAAQIAGRDECADSADSGRDECVTGFAAECAGVRELLQWGEPRDESECGPARDERVRGRVMLQVGCSRNG